MESGNKKENMKLTLIFRTGAGYISRSSNHLPGDLRPLMKNAIVLAGTFTTDGAQSKLIRDRTRNIAATDTPRFAAANLVSVVKV